MAHKYGWTALHLAAQLGHGEVVGALVRRGADVQATVKSSGRRVIHCAAEGGHGEVRLCHILRHRLPNLNITHLIRPNFWKLAQIRHCQLRSARQARSIAMRLH